MSSWRNSSYGDDDPTRVNLPPIERLDGGKFNRSHHDVPLPPIDCDPFSTREISELPSLPPLSDYLARRSDFSERYSACSIKSKLQLPKCTSFYERSGSSDSDEEHFRHPLDLDSNLRLPPIMLDLKFEQPDPLHVLYNSTPLAVQKNPKRGEYCDTYRPDMYSTCLYHKKNMTDYQDELQGMEKLAQKLADQRLSSTKVDSFHLVSNESIESGVCMSQDTWGSHRMINGLSDSTCIEEVLSRKRSWDQEYRQTEPAGASDQWSRDRRHSIATMSSPSSPIPNSSLPKKPHMISTRDIKMHTETSLSSNIQPLTLVSPDSTHFPDTLSHIQALLPTSESKQNNIGPCSGVKNHACNVTGCNMRFKRLEHLKRHLRVHTMERPYACTYTGCRKTFSRRDNLGQHLRTHQRQEAKAHSRQDSM